MGDDDEDFTFAPVSALEKKKLGLCLDTFWRFQHFATML